MTDTNRSLVEDIKPQSGLTDTEKEALVGFANRFVDDTFSGLVRTLSQIEGDEQDFKTLIAAHLWTLAEGGELQSEGQSGGSVSYNVNPGAIESMLSQTRWGRLARAYIREDAQVSVEWA